MHSVLPVVNDPLRRRLTVALADDLPEVNSFPEPRLSSRDRSYWLALACEVIDQILGVGMM